MRHTVLYKLLIKLDLRTLGKFEKFLDSSYFNQREDIKIFFMYYKSEIKKKDPKLLNDVIYKKVYNSSKTNAQELRLLYSRTFQLLKEFLFIERIKADKFEIGNSLSEEFKKLKEKELFSKTYDKTTKELEEEDWRDLDFYQKKFKLEQLYYDFISDYERTKENNLQILTDNLDVFYFIQKLNHACMIISHQSVFKKEYDVQTIKHMVLFLDNNETFLEKYPALNLTYNCYKALADENHQTHFIKLKVLLSKHKNIFRPKHIRFLYSIAINYCIKRINSGASDFYQELFTLYKDGIENEILLEDNRLTRFTYKNIVALAVGLKEYEWVEKFIYAYKEKLDPKYKDSYFTFNLAKLKQAQRKYEEAMSLLIHFNPEDILMTLAAKTNLLKMYFELQEFNSLDSLLNSMDKYLDRKKVLGYHKAHYKNLIKFSRKLISLPPYAKEEKLLLKKQIEASKMRSERDWLLKQLE